MRLPLLLLGAAAVAAPTQRPVLAPEAGHSVTKTITHKVALELAEADISISLEPDAPEVEVVLDWERTLVFTDVYGKTEGGRVRELTRTFDSIEHELNYTVDVISMNFEDSDENTVTGESALEGKSVRFGFDEDGDLTRAWAEDEKGDDALLDSLSLEADLAGFLPTGEVAEGDTWKIEGAAFPELLLPGGDLSLELTWANALRAPEFTAAGLDPGHFASFELIAGEPDEVEATATYLGLREVDGRELAVLGLAVTFSNSREVLEEMREWTEPVNSDMFSVDVQSGDLTLEVEARGELLWDLEAGRAASLGLEGDLLLEVERSCALDVFGTEVDVDLALGLEGPVSFQMTAR